MSPAGIPAGFLSDLVFNSIGYGVAKGESSKGKLNYPEYYGKLEAGKYMLAKPVSLRENSGDTPAEPEFFKGFAEFEIK